MHLGGAPRSVRQLQIAGLSAEMRARIQECPTGDQYGNSPQTKALSILRIPREGLPPWTSVSFEFLGSFTAEGVRQILCQGYGRCQGVSVGPSAIVNSSACPAGRSMATNMHEQMLAAGLAEALSALSTSLSVEPGLLITARWSNISQARLAHLIPPSCSVEFKIPCRHFVIGTIWHQPRLCNPALAFHVHGVIDLTKATGCHTLPTD
eukprot:763091-Pelagomonas_calceolata.AAC.1